MEKLIKPSITSHFNKVGGIFFPGSKPYFKQVEKGINIIQSFGIKLKYHPLEDEISFSETERINSIVNMLNDPEIGFLIAARGGYGTLPLLKHLDPHLFISHPKVIIGHSDVGFLLLYLVKEANLITFHGPMISDLEKIEQKSLVSLINLLKGRPTKNITIPSAYILKEGHVEGRLLGGNLTILTHLALTPYLPSFEGTILFIEDINEAPYRIDRMITALTYAGIFDKISGLILGEFINCGKEEEIFHIIKNRLKDFTFPIIGRFPIGHGRNNYTLPLGVEAKLSTKDKTLYLLEQPFL